MIPLTMAHALESPLAPLLRDFAALAARGDPFALATVVTTDGSTYRKAGTQMLIAPAEGPLGLLSGGCLEADLVEHARAVIASGKPRFAEYDMRGEDDRLFGIGSGCEGSMRILIQRVGGGQGPPGHLAHQAKHLPKLGHVGGRALHCLDTRNLLSHATRCSAARLKNR